MNKTMRNVRLTTEQICDIAEELWNRKHTLRTQLQDFKGTDSERMNLAKRVDDVTDLADRFHKLSLQVLS